MNVPKAGIYQVDVHLQPSLGQAVVADASRLDEKLVGFWGLNGNADSLPKRKELTGALVGDAKFVKSGAVHGGESFVIGDQLWIQAKSVLVTIAWSGVVSFIALKIAGTVVGGIRSDEDSEETGLDLTDHGESGYSS